MQGGMSMQGGATSTSDDEMHHFKNLMKNISHTNDG